VPTGFLFRGVNWRIHRDGKALTPYAPGEFLTPALYGTATYGEFTYGTSETNAVLTHERGGSRLTSGVSTTPHYHRADFYARTDNGAARD
jgi:hypothetical protein